MVEKLKKEYLIEDIILAADRGMINKANLEATLEKGYEFIMGERLKTLPKLVQAKLLNIEDYRHNWTSSSSDPEKTAYTVVEYQGRKIIGTFSQRRKEKDQKEREDKLIKAEKLLKNPSQLKKKASHYYLKNTGGEKYEVDTEKIKKNEKYDGILAIAYNAKSVTHEQPLDHYHYLYQIEHSFKTFKSYLETRSMFHWTDKRIKVHICLYYMAYSLLNNLQLRLAKKEFNHSEQTIRYYLSKMQVSLVNQDGNHFYMRSKKTEISQQLLQAVSEKDLPDLFSKDQIIKHL